MAEATRGRSHPVYDSSENLELSLGYGSGSNVRTISIPSNNETRHLDRHTYEIETLSPIRANTKKGRATHRKLLPIHVFMITVNATLGTGLYWRGGQILELGGFLAVIISFLTLGILSWLVTQCITELLCIWPVPGAMSVFVREFVDFELGIAVGIAYWFAKHDALPHSRLLTYGRFTYSVSFAALIASAAAEVHYWTKDVQVGIDAGVLYLLVPIILIILNCFGIQIYGWLEVATGVIKLLFLAVITISTLVFATWSRDGEKHSWTQPTTFDSTAAKSWFPALCICLSTATFAYVGVETPAAAALEARPTRASAQRRNQASNIGETIRFASKWTSAFACVAYTLSGIFVSLSVDPTDCRLPRVGWLNYHRCNTVQSAFVLVAENRGTTNIANVFNAFLVFTALSCANTNLYIASRTLFGLTNQIDGGPDEPWYLNILAWLGRTNNYRVPIRAMTVSAFAFIWVPFLQLYQPSTTSGKDGGSQKDGAIGGIDTRPFRNGLRWSTGRMGLRMLGIHSILQLVSHKCTPKESQRSLTYYFTSISKHHHELVERKVPRVQRFSDKDDNDYPYISNGQPVTAYIGLAGCLLVLLVLDGASLWNGFYVEPFLSSYLLVSPTYGPQD
ncbi:hypothetical protein Daesc_004013 [Daldinia eschscholtzii]|uniref:Amino acid permease/ SLC12A domain-containing protein n=1 Tax=Daldinia eschscholtzii TaxID=292717 RepID=A0AAX6MPD8_9PEZI